MEYYKQYTGSESASIIRALTAIGENSSYANRKLIAAANGIADYSGTATQNLLLLSLLKSGKLVKPTESVEQTTDTTAKKGNGRKWLIVGLIATGAALAAKSLFGNKNEPGKATKKKSRKGLNGVKCSYYTNESSGVSIASDNRKEFKQMLEDYAAKHPTAKAGGVAFMRHKNGNEEIMYGFSIHDGVVIYEPRIGNKKFLNGTGLNDAPRKFRPSNYGGKYQPSNYVVGRRSIYDAEDEARRNYEFRKWLDEQGYPKYQIDDIMEDLKKHKK